MPHLNKIYQDTKAVVMHRAQTLSSATVTYGDAVDTRGYDSAEIILNVGKIQGITTLSAVLQEAEVWSGDSNWVAVTGASFTITGATGGGSQQINIGAIETKSYKRYLALKLAATSETTAGSAPTIGVAVTAILGKGDKDPSGITPTFDLN